MDQRLIQLRQQVDDLLQWMADDKRQQIQLSSFGVNSTRLFQKNHMVATGYVAPFASVTPDTSLECLLDGEKLLLVATTV